MLVSTLVPEKGRLRILYKQELVARLTSTGVWHAHLGQKRAAAEDKGMHFVGFTSSNGHSSRSYRVRVANLTISYINIPILR